MFSNQFVFKFIRDNENEQDDDFLTIRKSRSGKSFILTYKSIDLKKTRTKQINNLYNLVEYLLTFLTLMKYDDSPFKYMQLDPPTLPSIIFDHKDFTSHRVIENIIDLVELQYSE
jgi:hypothetical protein